MINSSKEKGDSIMRVTQLVEDEHVVVIDSNAPLEPVDEYCSELMGNVTKEKEKVEKDNWHKLSYELCGLVFSSGCPNGINITELIQFLSSDVCPAAFFLSLKSHLVPSSHTSNLQFIFDACKFIDVQQSLTTFFSSIYNHEYSHGDPLVTSVIRAIVSIPGQYLQCFLHRSDISSKFQEKSLFPTLCSAILTPTYVTNPHFDVSKAESYMVVTLSCCLGFLPTSFVAESIVAMIESELHAQNTFKDSISILAKVLPNLQPLLAKQKLYRSLQTIASKNKRNTVLVTNVVLSLPHPEQDLVLSQLVQTLSFHTSREEGRAWCVVHMAYRLKALKRLMFSAVKAWGDPTFINTGNPEAHMFLSQVIVLGLVYWTNHTELKKLGNQERLLMEITQATSTHLSCVLEGVRWRGLAVTEIAAHMLVKDKQHQLDFNLLETPDVMILRGLSKESLLSDSPTDYESSATLASEEQSNISANNTVQTGIVGSDDLEYDSDDVSDDDDDTLPAYTLKSPTSTKNQKYAWVPKYISDALIGMKDKKDFKKVKASIEYLASLIESNPLESKRLAVKIVKDLVFAQNEFNIETFNQCKRESLVALVFVAPNESLEEIVRLFYEENASLGHRRLCLEIIVAGCARLAGRNIDTKIEELTTTTTQHKLVESIDTKDISNKEKSSTPKTRYFHPSYLKSKDGKGGDTKKGEKNKLISVVGLVFFPLIRFYDKPIRTLKMLKEDRFILSLLIRCLGILLFLSVHSNIFIRMAISFLNFSVALIDRPSIAQDADVQSSLLTSMCLMIDACPDPWREEMEGAIFPMYPYFKVLRSDNPNPESRELAIQLCSMLGI